MAKRRSEAERVLGFFKNASLETAQTLLELARAEVRSRTPKSTAKTTIIPRSKSDAKRIAALTGTSATVSAPDGEAA